MKPRSAAKLRSVPLKKVRTRASPKNARRNQSGVDILNPLRLQRRNASSNSRTSLSNTETNVMCGSPKNLPSAMNMKSKGMKATTSPSKVMGKLTTSHNAAAPTNGTNTKSGETKMDNN